MTRKTLLLDASQNIFKSNDALIFRNLYVYSFNLI